MQKKKQEELEAAGKGQPPTVLQTPSQIRIQKDINELQLPSTIKLTIQEPVAAMKNFEIIIAPDDGYYSRGIFRFTLTVNNNFPIEPPKVKCAQKIYHPNIDLDGNVCLNILREDWSPVWSLNAILFGLLHLFLEPNPNDPLNKESANMLIKDKNLFKRYVKSSMNGSAIDGVRYDYVMQ